MSEKLGKEIDVEFLVFVERHATDLLRWDIITFFGQNPDYCGTTPQIARRMGLSLQVIRPELGDLALQGVLEKTHMQDGNALYRLTKAASIRRLALKLAGSALVKPGKPRH